MKKHAARFALIPMLLSAVLFASCGVIHGPVDIQVLRESRPIGAAKELTVDLEYDVGQLEITRAADDLFAFDLQYDRNRYDPKFSFDAGDRSSMRLDLDSRGGGFGSARGGENELRLRLTGQVPLDLNLTSGVAESRLEMTGIKLRSMRLRGGVGRTEVTFDRPSGQVMNSLEVESGVGELIIHGLGNTQVGRLDLKGGVGHTELDFTGDLGTSQMDARIKVGVGAVKLTIPRDADVDIEAEGSFLSNISAPSFERNGRHYTHRGDGGARIRIQVESGVGAVEIDLI